MFREFRPLSSRMRETRAARSRSPQVDEALAHLSPITSQVQGLIDFVGSHPHFALIAVFLLASSEAVPVVGTVVPGSTAILGISALATTAQLDPWLLLMAATLGAIAGDGFSFWLGMRYHARILRLAARSLSAADRAQQGPYRTLRNRQRVPRPLHRGRPRVRADARRRAANVAAAFLRR
jgi:hypothetical protein